jgi:hypothetical protein
MARPGEILNQGGNMEALKRTERRSLGTLVRLAAVLVGLSVFAFGALGARADESANPLDAVPDAVLEQLSPEAQEAVGQVDDMLAGIAQAEEVDPLGGIVGLALLLVAALLLFPETGLIIFLALALLWLCGAIPQCPLPAL